VLHLELELKLVFVVLGVSEGLFEETSLVDGIENEKVRLNVFCQHEKVPYAEFT
jgi:hypothetical protein